MTSEENSYIELILIDGHQNYGNCDGKYYMDPSGQKLNDEIIWINESKQTFMGYTVSGEWVITGITFLDEVIKAGNKLNKGYHFSTSHSTDEDPRSSTWEHYTVTHNLVNNIIETNGTKKEGTKEIDEAGAFEFDPKKDTLNEYKGVYKCAPGRYVNDRHVYVMGEEYFMFWAGSIWAITSYCYLEDIEGKNEPFGYLECAKTSPNSRAPDGSRWTDYYFERVSGEDPGFGWKDILALSPDWEVYPETEIKDCYKFVRYENADIEKNFHSNRLLCIEEDYGGFIVTPAEFDQFGKEMQPSQAFYFRRTQSELMNSKQSHADKTLHLAPKEFKPDTAFKAGKDSAPSCHIEWYEPSNDNPVQAIAVQVRIPKGIPNSYYMVSGFQCGYSGIQTHSTEDITCNLFSVWNDTTAANYNHCLGAHPDVGKRAFGGEGAGVQTNCINDKEKGQNNVGNWINDETYTMVVEGHYKPMTGNKEGGIIFNMSLYDPAKGWIKFASNFRPMSKPDPKNRLKFFHSFIEAFGESETIYLRRSGYWGGCWFKFDNENVWTNCTEVSSTTTAELDRPDKQVIKVTASDGYDEIKMATGGDPMEDGDYGLYAGPVNFRPPPDYLKLYDGY